MGLFDFLGKTTDTKSQTSDAKAIRTLIALDWDKLDTEKEDFSFLQPYDHPRLLVFSKRREIPQEEFANLTENTEPHEVVQIPGRERTPSLFISLYVLHEYLTTNDYKHILLVSSNDRFKSTLSFLRDRQLPVELTLLRSPKKGADRGSRDNRGDSRGDSRNDSRGDNRNRGQDTPGGRQKSRSKGEERGGGRADSRNTPRDNRQNGGKPDNRNTNKGGGKAAGPSGGQNGDNSSRELPPVDNQALEELHSHLKQTFQRAKPYPRSRLGVAVRQATGKEMFDVFFTNSVKPLVTVLVEKDCLIEKDHQTIEVMDFPTLEQLKEIAQEFRNKAARGKPVKAPKTFPKSMSRSKVRQGGGKDPQEEGKAEEAPKQANSGSNAAESSADEEE